MNSLASIIIVVYNHRKYIGACIDSILAQEYPHEILIVDNSSQDGSADFVAKNYPQIKLIRSAKNIGYGAGNNLGVSFAKGRYIVILNPDIVVEKGWLEELIKPLTSEERLITTPKILIHDGSLINTCGNLNHFTGLTFTRCLGADPEENNQLMPVSGVSGACFALVKENYLDLGGFDEKFFLYNEDADLSWRAHLKDYCILFVSSSVIRHEYSLRVSPIKIYHLEKGRYIIIRKYLSYGDIVKLLPSLIVVEALTFAYASKHGWTGLKLKSQALFDGMTCNVEKISGNKKNLFNSLSCSIPLDQLTDNGAERTFKLLSNILFEYNFKAIK